MAKDQSTNVWRLEGEDLSSTDLEGSDLRGARLWQVNLSGARLAGADLSQAQMKEARLDKSSLRSARLSGVNLCGADLSGADLSGADLSQADLTDAILDEAVLIDTILDRAILVGASMAGARVSGSQWTGVTVTRSQWSRVTGAPRISPAVAANWRRRVYFTAAATAAVLLCFVGLWLVPPPSPAPLQLSAAGYQGVLGAGGGDDLLWDPGESVVLTATTGTMNGRTINVSIDLLDSPRQPGVSLYQCMFETQLLLHGSEERVTKAVSCADHPTHTVEVSVTNTATEFRLPGWTHIASVTNHNTDNLSSCLAEPEMAIRMRVAAQKSGCMGEMPALEAVVPLCEAQGAEKELLRLQTQLVEVAKRSLKEENGTIGRHLSIVLADALMQSRLTSVALDISTARALCDASYPQGPDENAAYCAHYHRLAEEQLKLFPDDGLAKQERDASLNLLALAMVDLLPLHGTGEYDSAVKSNIADELRRITAEEGRDRFGGLHQNRKQPCLWDNYILLINSARAARVPEPDWALEAKGASLTAPPPTTPTAETSSLQWNALAREDLEHALKAASELSANSENRELLGGLLLRKLKLEVNAVVSWVDLANPEPVVDACAALVGALEHYAEWLRTEFGGNAVRAESDRHAELSKELHGAARYVMQALGYSLGLLEQNGGYDAAVVSGLVTRMCRVFPDYRACLPGEASSQDVMLAALDELLERELKTKPVAGPIEEQLSIRYMLTVRAWLAWNWARRVGNHEQQTEAMDLAVKVWDALERKTSRDPGTSVAPLWSNGPYLGGLWRMLAAAMEEGLDVDPVLPQADGDSSKELSWRSLPAPSRWLRIAERVRGRAWFRPLCGLRELSEAVAHYERFPCGKQAPDLVCLQETASHAPDWSMLDAGGDLPFDLLYFSELPLSGRLAVIRWARGQQAEFALVDSVGTWRGKLAPWLDATTAHRATDRKASPAAEWRRVDSALRGKVSSIFNPVSQQVDGDLRPLAIVPSRSLAWVPWPALPVSDSATPLLMSRSVVEAPDLGSMFRRPADRADSNGQHLLMASARRQRPVTQALQTALETAFGSVRVVTSVVDSQLAAGVDKVFGSITIVAHHAATRDMTARYISALPVVQWLVHSLHIDEAPELGVSSLSLLASRARLLILYACSTSKPLDAPAAATDLRPLLSIGAHAFRNGIADVVGFRVEVPDDNITPFVEYFVNGLIENGDTLSSFVAAQRRVYEMESSGELWRGQRVLPWHWSAPYLHSRDFLK